MIMESTDGEQLAFFEPPPVPVPAFGEDPALDEVQAELERCDPTGDRVAGVLRGTLDQLYDGQHTGRYSYDDLRKTEKTHMGTLVEINLQNRFEFGDGDVTDYRIAGHEVDCKYSMTWGSWELPPEAENQLCLLLSARDLGCWWAAGLLRVRPEYLREGQNRDAKRQLATASLGRIRRLWAGHQRLTPNLFLELDPVSLAEILGARAVRGHQHGQARTNELFRRVQGRIIRRAELATVARQDDFMKRARGNGGARTQLRADGILVLGHQDRDPEVARALGLPVPRKGEFISARVVPAGPAPRGPCAEIAGERWTLAAPGDPVVTAPAIARRPPDAIDLTSPG
jgi:hypothetical protein